jgi:histone H3/H4
MSTADISQQLEALTHLVAAQGAQLDRIERLLIATHDCMAAHDASMHTARVQQQGAIANVQQELHRHIETYEDQIAEICYEVAQHAERDSVFRKQLLRLMREATQERTRALGEKGAGGNVTPFPLASGG